MLHRTLSWLFSRSDGVTDRRLVVRLSEICIHISDTLPPRQGQLDKKYRRFGSCGLVPTSRTSPRSTRRTRRVRVARGVSPIAFAISLVTRPVPSRRVPRMASSVLSTAGTPTCSSHSVTLNRAPISSSVGDASPASRQADVVSPARSVASQTHGPIRISSTSQNGLPHVQWEIRSRLLSTMDGD